MIVSKETASSYEWGDNCHAWVLAENDSFSIKEETMPPGTAEKKHFHKVSKQFFYILEGEATVCSGEKSWQLTASQGIEVKPHVIHLIKNEADSMLRFLVVSVPAVGKDRFEVAE